MGRERERARVGRERMKGRERGRGREKKRERGGEEITINQLSPICNHAS